MVRVSNTRASSSFFTKYSKPSRPFEPTSAIAREWNCYNKQDAVTSLGNKQPSDVINFIYLSPHVSAPGRHVVRPEARCKDL